MAAIKTLLVKFDADTSAGKKGIADINHEVGKSKGLFSGAKDAFLGFLGAQAVISGISTAWDFLSSTIGDAIKEGSDANQVISQTNAVLASTHQVAGVTAQHVDDLANKYMGLTGIQDDTVRSTENMLLTFTNIGAKGGIFDQATQTALDMSVALGQDTKSSAIQLGKALNDPLTGITALQRVGVTFNAQQKEQIANFMKGGNVAGAQGVILKELNREFGGSAEAAGKANGGVKIFAAELDNMKQSLGQAIIPILGKLAGAVEPLVQQFGKWLPGALDQASGFVEKNLMPAVGKLTTWITKDGMPDLKALGDFVLKDVVPALGELADWAEKNVLPAVEKMATFVQTQVLPTLKQFAEWAETKVVPALEKLGAFVLTKVVPALAQMFAWVEQHVVPILETLGNIIIDDVIPPLENIWTQIATKVVPQLEKLWDKIQPVLIPALQALGWVLKNVVGPAISDAVGLIGWLLDKLNGLLDTLGKVKDAAGNALGGLGNLLSKIPGFAEGTDNAPGGLAWVGESGKELMYVPKGAQIIPHDESMRISQSASNASSALAMATANASAAPTSQLSSGSVTVHMHVNLNGREIADAVGPEIGLMLRQMGVRF